MKSQRLLYLLGCLLIALSCARVTEPEIPEEQQEERVQVDSVIVSWLKANVQPLITSDPSLSYADLQPLKQIVGDAHLVALGEATHGTREFFRMKDRLLRFLVQEMGFTMFGIEATWPEGNLVNEYVQTGKGDPAKLLAGLYFWTWNTQEVLDMILWMRAYNATNPAQKLSFHGFDMQSPRMAMDNVISYLENVDQPATAWADSMYNPFRFFLPNLNGYKSASPDVIEQCRQNMKNVYDFLLSKQEMYELASSVKAFATALQSARVAIQGEQVYSGRPGATRDQFMAENTDWILQQAPPSSKMVLWAHNFHVSRSGYNNYGSTGAYLHSQHGSDLVVIGFDFYKGSFNAVTWDAPAGKSAGALGKQVADLPSKDTYEYIFRGADLPMFLIDLREWRGQTSTHPATSWISGPRRYRSIGAVYDPRNPHYYYYGARLPNDFDCVIYFEQTTSSILLPF